MPTLLQFADWVIQALMLLIVVSSVLTWIPVPPRNAFVRFVHGLVDPLLHPIRALMPTSLGLDFSPMVAILVLWLLQSFLRRSFDPRFP